MRFATPSFRERRSGMVRAVVGIWPNGRSEASRVVQEAMRCGEKKLVDAKESQDECFYQAGDSMVEGRVLERLAL